MSFAEIILRVGSSIGGWLIFLGLALTLAVVPEASCDPGSDELWRGTLLFALLTALALVFAGRGLAWRSTIRWFVAPSIALAVYALLVIFPALRSTSLDGQSLCLLVNTPVTIPAGFEASMLERCWPLVQVGVLGFGVIQGIRYWRPAPGPPDAA